MDQGVIRRDARLPSVGELAEDDTAQGGLVNMTPRHDHRTFAAELKRDGYEVLACRLHDLSPDLCAACEKQMVEGQAAEHCADIRTTGHNRHFLERENVREHALDYGTGARRQF
jgi:hypothetical protein